MRIFVYTLRCADGSYYVGSTRAGLEQRISQHNSAHFGGYTAKRPSGRRCGVPFDTPRRGALRARRVERALSSFTSESPILPSSERAPEGRNPGATAPEGSVGMHPTL